MSEETEIDEALDERKELSENGKPDRGKVEERIKLAEDKIKTCWNLLKKMNEVISDDVQDITYEQANIFIYFIETLSLEGDASVKKELKKHFSQYYPEDDRKRFAGARSEFLKKRNKYLVPNDIKEFMNCNVKVFFRELERYVEYIQDVKDFLKSVNKCESGNLKQTFDGKFNIKGSKISEEKRLQLLFEWTRSSSNTNDESKCKSEIRQFIGNLVDEKIIEKFEEHSQGKQKRGFFITFKSNCNMGEDTLKSYAKKEFGKLIGLAYREENITQEVLFDYVVNFYPVCENLYDVNELRYLRNNLIHNFHKYGAIECKQELYKIRHKLFHYFYAQEVIGALRALEADERPEVIDKKLRKKLVSLDENISGLRGEYVISTDEAKDFSGYKFLEKVYTEREGTKKEDIQPLVDQYLKFMIIFDHAEESQDQSSVSREKPSALCRRTIFEKFGELVELLTNEDNDGYKKKRQELGSKLLQEHGVQSHHFKFVCRSYLKKGRESDHNDRDEITGIIQTLKKMSDDYQLSNRFLVFLYDQHLKGEALFSSDESRRIVANESARLSIVRKFKELPPDKSIGIKIEKETLSISREKVIRNMLNTFYDTYNKYTIEFDIEEIFNDETFINYLVEKETEYTKVEDLVDRYLKLTLMIQSDRLKIDETSKLKILNGESIRKIFEGFYRLKSLKGHIQDHWDVKYYEKEKEKYRDLVCCHGIKEENFNRLIEFCVENDCELIDEQGGSEKVSTIIKDLREKLEKSGIKNNKEIASLCNKVVGKAYTSEQVEDILDYKYQYEDKDEVKTKIEKIVGILNEKLYKSVNDEVKIKLGKEVWPVNIQEVASNLLAAFADKLELKPRNYMMIKKLLKNSEYTAPYIARSITKVNSDVLIEKVDLLKLVKILLKKEKGLYIKHLNELLTIKSRKLNLYGEVCNIMGGKFEIDSMRCLLENLQHAREILTVLIDRIKSDDKSLYDTVHLSEKVLETLLKSGLKHIPQKENNDERLEVLKRTLELIEEIKRSNKIAKLEYNIKIKMAKVLSFQGMEIESECKTEAEVKYEAIRKISVEIINKNVNPESLLALSYEAWALAKLEDYDQSVEKRKKLCEKIEQIKLRDPRYENPFADNEIFPECKKYLDILYIREQMAQARLSNGLNKKSVEDCNEALKIYNEVYNYKKMLYPEHTSTLKDLRYIAEAHTKISNSMFRQTKYQDALEHAAEACLRNCTLFNDQKDMYGCYHPAVIKCIKYVEINQNQIDKSKKWGAKLPEAKEQELRKALEKFDGENIVHQQHYQ